jgi:hypothetical protein
MVAILPMFAVGETKLPLLYREVPNASHGPCPRSWSYLRVAEQTGKVTGVRLADRSDSSRVPVTGLFGHNPANRSNTAQFPRWKLRVLRPELLLGKLVQGSVAKRFGRTEPATDARMAFTLAYSPLA